MRGKGVNTQEKIETKDFIVLRRDVMKAFIYAKQRQNIFYCQYFKMATMSDNGKLSLEVRCGLLMKTHIINSRVDFFFPKFYIDGCSSVFEWMLFCLSMWSCNEQGT